MHKTNDGFKAKPAEYFSAPSSPPADRTAKEPISPPLPRQKVAGALALRKARAQKLCTTLQHAPALEILDTTIHREFRGRIALVSSFGTESAVLLALVAQTDPHLPIIFLDTGKHFAQTLSYKRKLGNHFGLTDIRTITPDESALKNQDPDGNLWKKDADLCCQLRKVIPLASALDGIDAWISGRKQFQGGLRASLPVIEANETHFKINPIVRWQPEDIAAFEKAHTLPPHPLITRGFPSVGCWPCTHPVAHGDDGRAGRWRGQAKTECGIHHPS